MTKRTIATKWDLFSRDETGGLGFLDYTCPYCHWDNDETILIGAGNLDKIDNDFETDQVCAICGKDVIIECRN